jgi:hypothetical protein
MKALGLPLLPAAARLRVRLPLCLAALLATAPAGAQRPPAPQVDQVRVCLRVEGAYLGRLRLAWHDGRSRWLDERFAEVGGIRAGTEHCHPVSWERGRRLLVEARVEAMGRICDRVFDRAQEVRVVVGGTSIHPTCAIS